MPGGAGCGAGKTISGSSPPEETSANPFWGLRGLRRRTLPVVLPAPQPAPPGLCEIFVMMYQRKSDVSFQPFNAKNSSGVTAGTGDLE